MQYRKGDESSLPLLLFYLGPQWTGRFLSTRWGTIFMSPQTEMLISAKNTLTDTPRDDL